jgi:sensor domain CHASE-containing protein
VPTTAGATDVGMGVCMCVFSCGVTMAAARFYGVVVAVVAVDDLGGDVVVEEARDDLNADESEDEEGEE